MMFNFLKKFGILSLFALMILSLQGCITTAVIGTAAVATKVATDPRTTGRQIDDETLEERISYRLNKDSQLREEARINVVVYDAKALLIGQVSNEAAKQTAQNITAGVEGLSEIYNEIRIGKNIGVAQITKDSWITTKIKSLLFFDSVVKATDVKVITENGEVFLMGKLTSSQANIAANVAANQRSSGVKKVVKVITYRDN